MEEEKRWYRRVFRKKNETSANRGSVSVVEIENKKQGYIAS